MSVSMEGLDSMFSGNGGFSSEKRRNGGGYPLTGIPDAYTLASPQEQEPDDRDKIMVKHFLNTLAEIALSIASRRLDR